MCIYDDKVVTGIYQFDLKLCKDFYPKGYHGDDLQKQENAETQAPYRMDNPGVVFMRRRSEETARAVENSTEMDFSLRFASLESERLTSTWDKERRLQRQRTIGDKIVGLHFVVILITEKGPPGLGSDCIYR